jgi:hypothetical protein
LIAAAVPKLLMRLFHGFLEDGEALGVVDQWIAGEVMRRGGRPWLIAVMGNADVSGFKVNEDDFALLLRIDAACFPAEAEHACELFTEALRRINTASGDVRSLCFARAVAQVQAIAHASCFDVLNRMLNTIAQLLDQPTTLVELLGTVPDLCAGEFLYNCGLNSCGASWQFFVDAYQELCEGSVPEPNRFATDACIEVNQVAYYEPVLAPPCENCLWE